ncbi:MAG TPA: O-antigen ligase family protein [Steroidobacter sp.]|uniref:O-antigen ligase family protein n=1 Tax=Steroidobacter sp. TaxID=1978227 RepID=UPI002ED77466
MSQAVVTSSPSSVRVRINRFVGLSASFALAAVTGLALTLDAFVESLNSARLAAVILALFLLQLIRVPRFAFTRELALYAMFFSYMVIQLLWTDDLLLARNTIVPAAAFLLILVQVGALAAYHDLRAVLGGVLAGNLIGAAYYTSTTGFPFAYPADFSYNAIASVYLFGFIVALLLSLYKRSSGPVLLIALVLMLHIVATTSIKANLGIALGTLAAGIFYFRHFARMLRRNAIALAALAGLLAIAVASNAELLERLQSGMQRVALGIEVLQARDNVAGYSALDDRSEWLREGLSGWALNPLFGHGVEAFRSRFGITSHSTPVDLLYNSGLAGFALFYGIFMAMTWRLLRARRTGRTVDALLFGAVVCYVFITMSGTMHYNSSLAAFIALGTAILRSHSPKPSQSENPPGAARL